MNVRQPRQNIFYSWQADLAPGTNRNFILDALEKAVRTIRNDKSLQVEPVVDRDTRGTPGAPMIAETILSKIDAATGIVSDITIIGKTESGRPTPNPNVLMELGYALKALQPERLVMVLNEAFGSIQDLPFDLRHRRILRYNLNERAGSDVRSRVKRELQRDLENAIREILTLPVRQGDIPHSMVALRGAAYLRDKAALTIGPRSGRIDFRREERSTNTRDGLEIARWIWTPDLFERHGMSRLADVAEELRFQAGDGAKTSMLLCFEMIRAGYENLDSGKELAGIVKGMETAAKKVVDQLRAVSESPDETDLFRIARTAGGEATAKLLMEALRNNRNIAIENGAAPSISSIEVRKGFWLSTGYVSDEFANDPITGNCIYENCFVMVCGGRLSSIHEVMSVLDQVVATQTPIAIVAEDFDDQVIGLLIENHNAGRLPCVAIKVPGPQDQRRIVLKDLASVTGGVLLGGIFGPSLTAAQLSHLGKAKRLVVTSESSQIIRDVVDDEKLKMVTARIRQQIAQTSSYANYKLQERLANLIGDVVLIKVGGRTATDLAEQRYRIQTALASTRLAETSGFVVGGGLALFRAKQVLERSALLKEENESQRAGILMALRAMEEPLRCLLGTTHLDMADALDSLSQRELDIGLNVESGQYVNLREEGVLDSTDVLSAAVEIAVLQAKTVLETSSWELLMNPSQLSWNRSF
jgi:chaperonin GroEL